MKLNIDKYNLLAGMLIIAAGILLGYLDIFAGCATAALGGIIIQVRFDKEIAPIVKPITKKKEKIKPEP